jgi:glycosyltransferase involved in cell wall biosynthesis
LPNRYHTFSQDAAEFESHPGIEIRRIKLPSHRSSMRGQARAFFYFAREVLRITANKKYDLVFATSSRLMTASLGAWIARRKRAPLYLDIRDMFVDTIREMLPVIVAWPIGQVFSVLECWTMRRANRINLVSRGFESYFRSRHGERSLAWFTNGIDDEFLAHTTACKDGPGIPGAPTTILYAGNMGEGQQLHEIVPVLARALNRRARFVLIGDGGRRRQLEMAVASSHVDNVEFRSPMCRAALLRAYDDADVFFLHLGAYPAFEKVLPSKLFEYAALGKPVLAGVAGFAARFVTEEIENAAVFPPGDALAAVSAFDTLELVTRPRTTFVSKYARSTIARAMAEDVLELLRCAS